MGSRCCRLNNRTQGSPHDNDSSPYPTPRHVGGAEVLGSSRVKEVGGGMGTWLLAFSMHFLSLWFVCPLHCSFTPWKFSCWTDAGAGSWGQSHGPGSRRQSCSCGGVPAWGAWSHRGRGGVGFLSHVKDVWPTVFSYLEFSWQWLRNSVFVYFPGSRTFLGLEFYWKLRVF